MYKIYLRYYDKVETTETSEELFQLYQKMEHMAKLEMDTEEFDEICETVDNIIMEITREKFNIPMEDELELEYLRTADDEIDGYSKVVIYNLSEDEPTDWGKTFEDRYNYVTNNIPVARKVINFYIDFNPVELYKENNKNYNEWDTMFIFNENPYYVMDDMIKNWINENIIGEKDISFVKVEKKPILKTKEEIQRGVEEICNKFIDEVGDNDEEVIKNYIIRSILEWVVEQSWVNKWTKSLL
jgi:hypothetical protein